MPRTLYVYLDHPRKRRQHKFIIKDGIVAEVYMLDPNGGGWGWLDTEHEQAQLHGSDMFEFMEWLNKARSQPSTHTCVSEEQGQRWNSPPYGDYLKELHAIHSTFLLSFRRGGRY